MIMRKEELSVPSPLTMQCSNEHNFPWQLYTSTL